MSALRIRFSAIAFAAALCIAAPPLAAEVRLPALMGSHMVLQRDRPVRLWGWANPGEVVRISIGPTTAQVETGRDGRWSVELPGQPAGGPHNLTIASGIAITLQDVWFGEVWLASGQSNMEWQLSQSEGGAEAAAAGCDELRLFTVAKATSLTPKDDVSGEWLACNASTAPPFSAVAFHFAKEIARTLGVKVGIIHSSWGGTPAEAWTSRESLAANPALREMVAEFDAALSDTEAKRTYAARLDAWEKANYPQDPGNDGEAQGWQLPATATSDWRPMELPQQWEKAGLALDGVVWFRRTIEIPPAWAGRDLRLSLGPLDDFDVTYFQGQQVGRTGRETPGYWSIPRQYDIPGRLVVAGPAVIAVRVFDHFGGGGFSGAAPQLWIAPPDGDQTSLPLVGTWLYKVERTVTPSTPDFSTQPRIPSADNPNSPTVLYGGMIAPLTPYAIRGVIWYQGESNAVAAHLYRTLFPTLIRDWRRAWGRPDLPFLYVQLANYQQRNPQPGDSAWAELRDAQLLALAMPATGMAVAIDLGDANDIHPRNKKDVGHRLARWALADTYGRNLVKSGPLFDTFSIAGSGALRISFQHAAGLRTSDGQPPRGFAIAGTDRVWHWAQARLEDASVVVSSPEVPLPVAVRYAWADNPEATLVNGEGLPASPFRTDDWPGLTGPRP